MCGTPVTSFACGWVRSSSWQPTDIAEVGCRPGPHHRNRSVEGFAQWPGAAYPEAQRWPDVLGDPAGRVEFEGGERVDLGGPLVVGGHHDADAESLRLVQGRCCYPLRVNATGLGLH